MANVKRPGFWPVGTVSGSPWQGSVRSYQTDAAAEVAFIGDLVAPCADGYVNVISATTDLIIGSVVGILPVPPQSLGSSTLSLSGATAPALSQKQSTKGTPATLLVCTAPDAIYETDAEGTASVADIGQTCPVTIVTGDTNTGLSKQVCNITGGGTTNSAQLRVIDIPDRIDNTAGVANCHVLVVVNKHAYAKPAAAGI